jgi:hypothetical protein
VAMYETTRHELGSDYVRIVPVGAVSAIVQAMGVTPVRIAAVPTGAAAPPADADGYFLLRPQSSGADSVIVDSSWQADVYARSDSEDLLAYVTELSA